MRTLLCLIALSALVQEGAKDEKKYSETFAIDPKDWASTGTNPYFVLEPGYVLQMEDGKTGILVITVLEETKKVDGVETRVVEEHESEDGKVVEISRNYFAFDKRTSSVYYFGEDVDIYKDGKVAGHDGSWLSGEKGAKFGLAMPGQALLGARYYQEQAPEVAMDRAEIVSLTEKLETTAGKFEKCLKTLETNALKPKEKGYKLYAPGIGMIQDDELKLTRFGMGKK